jgi:hypothetical protein
MAESLEAEVEVEVEVEVEAEAAAALLIFDLLPAVGKGWQSR